MAAYLIAFARIKNAARLPEYAEAARPTLAEAGGSIVARGKLRSLIGNFRADSCLIVKFADAAAVERWYRSDAYQSLVSIRNEVMEPDFLLLDEPS